MFATRDAAVVIGNAIFLARRLLIPLLVIGGVIGVWAVQVKSPAPAGVPNRIQLRSLEDFERTTFFDERGVRVFYAASSEGGFELFGGPGVHPQTGVVLEPVTVEVQRRILEWLRGLDDGQPNLRPPPGQLQSQSKGLEFFDRSTGAPLVWYSVDSSGNYALFDGPGADPITGVELVPADGASAEAIRTWIAALERRRAESSYADSVQKALLDRERMEAMRLEEQHARAARYFNQSCGQGDSPAVHVQVDGRFLPEETSKLASRLGARTDCFTTAFEASGLFDRAIRGDVVELTALAGGRALVLVSIVSTTERVTPAGETMVKVTAHAMARIIRSGAESQASAVTAAGQGLGFRPSAATEQALSAVVDSLAVRLRPVLGG